MLSKGHRRTLVSGVALISLSLLAGRANAWGPNGHKTVAAIAEKLIDGTKAGEQVHAILGSTTLEDAAVWPDCAKGVEPHGNPAVFGYTGAGHYPECAPFETPDGEAEMVDFVKRNYDTCKPKPGEEVCHKQYHYSDISIDHDDYESGFVGARGDDVEMAIAAAVDVLRGKAAPAPFSITTKREALLLLVHYAGDIHQPLHVGAIYLDAEGHPVAPDTAGYDLATETRGGNEILVSAGHNLHAAWDATTASLYPDKVDKAWVAAAKAVPTSAGGFAQWSVSWATDTQKQAQKAFTGLKFGPKSGKTWNVTMPRSYSKSMNAIKKTQLTKGGARLAQLLEAIWPESEVAARVSHGAP
jgi:S1/P1 Nuclease